MHLRRPQPGRTYQLLLRLTRDHTLLDQRAIPFDLVFVERDEAMAEAEALEWTARGAAIAPLPPDEDIPDALLVDDPAPLDPSPNGSA
jgi:hypothetical protein